MQSAALVLSYRCPYTLKLRKFCRCKQAPTEQPVSHRHTLWKAPRGSIFRTKTFGRRLRYPLRTGQTAVLWVTAHSCCVSRSNCRISEYTKECDMLWHCLIARCRERPCLAPFDILSSSAFCSQCLRRPLRSFTYLREPGRWTESLALSGHTGRPLLTLLPYLPPGFPAHSISSVFGVRFVTTKSDGAAKPQERAPKCCALKLHPVRI